MRRQAMSDSPDDTWLDIDFTYEIRTKRRARLQRLLTDSQIEDWRDGDENERARILDDVLRDFSITDICDDPDWEVIEEHSTRLVDNAGHEV